MKCFIWKHPKTNPMRPCHIFQLLFFYLLNALSSIILHQAPTKIVKYNPSLPPFFPYTQWLCLSNKNQKKRNSGIHYSGTHIFPHQCHCFLFCFNIELKKKETFGIFHELKFAWYPVVRILYLHIYRCLMQAC